MAKWVLLFAPLEKEVVIFTGITSPVGRLVLLFLYKRGENGDRTSYKMKAYGMLCMEHSIELFLCLVFKMSNSSDHHSDSFLVSHVDGELIFY